VRLAWFRATAIAHATPLDPTAALIAGLQTMHDLEVFIQDNAHDFVWKAFRAPYDLCVFELDNDRSHAFVWPYLLQYGGILFLRTLTLHDARALALVRQGRRDDYTAEFAFNQRHAPPVTKTPPFVKEGTWPMLRVPLMASRIAVVPHKGMAAVVQEEYPDARVVFAPPAVREPSVSPPQSPAGPLADGLRSASRNPPYAAFGVLSSDRVDVVRRAVTRAQEAGAAATLLIDDSPDRLLQSADVIVTLEWPSFGEPQMCALAAMAAGKPVIVLETEYTADWPALDPQTWQSRGSPRRGLAEAGPGAAAPIVVSIDLRDEEHSLTVAMRRLSADGALREQLGEAGGTWCRAHTAARPAADAWQRILSDAAALEPPPRPAGWPAHLNADGTEHARATLADFGITTDFLAT